MRERERERERELVGEKRGKICQPSKERDGIAILISNNLNLNMSGTGYTSERK